MGSNEMAELTRALENSPRKAAPRRVNGSPRRVNGSPRRVNGSPKKLKVRRRQSAVVLGGGMNRDFHQHQHLRSRSSLDSMKYTVYTLPRPSFATDRVEEPLNSYEQPSSRAPRSSLERKVIGGLRGSFESRGPRLQRSTSGMAFDDSDKENCAPKY